MQCRKKLLGWWQVRLILVEVYKLVAAQVSVGLGSRGGGLTRVGLDEELSLVFLSEILVLVT